MPEIGKALKEIPIISECPSPRQGPILGFVGADDAGDRARNGPCRDLEHPESNPGACALSLFLAWTLKVKEKL